MGSAFDLTGKVVLVTGGNSGIGFGMASALAQAGAAVCIWGRSAERNASACDLLQRHGTKVASREVDVREEAQVVGGMTAALDDFGRLDACFANAAAHGGGAASFIESTTAQWRETTALILDSVYFTLREAAKVLVAQGSGGSLVATSSLASNYGSTRGDHAYASAKGAVNSLMRGLAVELARHRIRCNTILPAWVEGGFMEPIHSNEKASERIMQRMPMRRWGEADELGALAVYLAGDGSTWHTGNDFILDGGYHLF
jgi:NAD(P)-dependent dehydrogenase (short-subunit alcohol dehydrogenase family)